eukprot:gnl/TRDRNA2_/TRDRNA2_176083_c0_seq6.p1 gnl/TRDRNA2_/TRDRNA2_176083_c0~~gnl/TRDRNA2_/TRDRNA2_176083_c0_seq6.p1  ORF type:complete len:178 (-),score=20.02 gnl/TRDRNA2_/TRDRNA2_176083_c0_seq6:522-1055(-)
MAATDGKGTANAKDVVESDLGKDVPQVESYESAKHSDASQPKTDVSLADLVGLSLEDPSVAPVRNPLVTHGEEIPKIYFYRRPLEPGETSTTEINIYNAPRVSYDFNHLKGKGDEFRRSILPPGDMLILKCKHYELSQSKKKASLHRLRNSGTSRFKMRGSLSPVSSRSISMRISGS